MNNLEHFEQIKIGDVGYFRLKDKFKANHLLLVRGPIWNGVRFLVIFDLLIIFSLNLVGRK